MRPMKHCSFAGCEKPFRRNGLCGGHSQQLKAGRPLKPLRSHRLSLGQQEKIRRLANLPILEGKTISPCHGYPYVHLDRTNKKYFIHRLVMEAHLGRRLSRREVVHHGKLGKLNPSLANLELFASQSDHVKQRHSEHPLYGPALENSLKTHCSRRHRLAGKNLRKGTRQCRLCHNLNQNRRNAERRLQVEGKIPPPILAPAKLC